MNIQWNKGQREIKGLAKHVRYMVFTIRVLFLIFSYHQGKEYHDGLLIPFVIPRTSVHCVETDNKCCKWCHFQ